MQPRTLYLSTACLCRGVSSGSPGHGMLEVQGMFNYTARKVFTEVPQLALSSLFGRGPVVDRLRETTWCSDPDMNDMVTWQFIINF